MVITLSGAFGCGTREVAEKLAEITGYKICNDEVFAQLAEKYGFDSEATTLKYYDVDSESFNVKEIEKISNSQKKYRQAVKSLTYDVMPLDLRMDDAMRGIETELAKESNYIILGHCANYYLRNRKDTITLFFYDYETKRLERIMKRFDVDAVTAANIIKKTDKRRSDFYSYFTSTRWNDPENYDFRINTSKMGIDGTAQLIKSMIAICEPNR